MGKDSEVLVDADGLSTYTQTLKYTPKKEHKTLWCQVQHPSLNHPIEASVELVFVEPEPEPSKLGPGATVSIIMGVLIALSVITILFIFYRTKVTGGMKDDDEEGADGEKIPLESAGVEEDSTEKSNSEKAEKAEEKVVASTVNEVKEEPKNEVEEAKEDKGEKEKQVEEKKEEEKKEEKKKKKKKKKKKS